MAVDQALGLVHLCLNIDEAENVVAHQLDHCHFISSEMLRVYNTTSILLRGTLRAAAPSPAQHSTSRSSLR